jgi:hypothetical protein
MEIVQTDMAVWHGKLVEFTNGLNGPPTSPDAQRCSVLISASKSNDLFFLVLHQFYCLWSTDQKFLHSILPLHSELFRRAFDFLATILHPNTRIQPQHLVWFAQFPFSSRNPAQNHSYYLEASTKIATFLASFVQNWSALLSAVHHRRYPIMVQEMVGHLGCPSIRMQNLLFVYSWRILGHGDMSVADEFASTLQVDQANEQQAALHADWQQVHQTRHNIKLKYISIASRMNPQSNIVGE